MTNLQFAVDELEVDVLEPRHEMAIQLPPSTCAPSTCAIVHTDAAIHPPPSTCAPVIVK